ncbi:amidohydrolase [Herbivorax sp. ANBcel31]|uniref:amidohydrolase n=1 Tax=Herbivorax sp. ANBcel31 TaxID=3069754 RepID=UPI0027B6012C|nr:amidohydrolase [Herbivorax sp. ANBcel31]MDQ2086217.1 amidohydrolase [Herbivorax sp. ANBcel31]
MLLIKNGKILTMAGANYNKGYILIKEKKIIKVGDMTELDESEFKDSDITVIDAKGKYVLPGFIDAHCHVGICEDSVGFEGDDTNEMTDPVTPHLRAIDGVFHMDKAFVEARENGVTTVVTGPGSANVIGGQFAALKTYGRRVEEMVVKDPVAVKIAFGENPKTVYAEKKQSPSTRMATAALLRENLISAKEYKELIQKHNDDMENNDKPDYDMKLEALLKVLNREIPFKAHAHRADDILTAIRIAREFDVDLTIEHCTEGHLITDILCEEGVGTIIGPSISDRSKVELRNLTIKTPGILSKAGIKVAIMTDHPCTPVQYLTVCAAMAVREGMDEEEALKAITINAALLNGIEDRVGSIEAGKDGDITIFDGHPFEFKSKTMATIINGKVVYERKNNEKI